MKPGAGDDRLLTPAVGPVQKSVARLEEPVAHELQIGYGAKELNRTLVSAFKAAVRHLDVLVGIWAALHLRADFENQGCLSILVLAADCSHPIKLDGARRRSSAVH